MPVTLKIEVTPKIKGVKEGTLQKVIIGVSLSGNGQYDRLQVANLLKCASNFKHCWVLLHGNEEQCKSWRQLNRESIDSAVILN